MSPLSYTLSYLDQFLIFVLVLTRVGSLLMTLPVLGTATVPMQVRALLAVGISLDPDAALLGPANPPPENLLHPRHAPGPRSDPWARPRPGRHDPALRHAARRTNH